MRRVILIIFVLCSVFAYGKELSQIENITMVLKEQISLNGEKKSSKYKLYYIKPDFIRKDMLEPEFNRGEIYIYTQDKKIVYLPLFQQVTEEKIDKNENEVLDTINFILDKVRDDEQFKKEYYSQKIKKIELENKSRIVIDKFKRYEGYLLPTTFKIYDGDILLVVVEVESYKINSDISVEELLKYD